MKTVAAVEDIREELRQVSAQARELSPKDRYRSGAVRRRDELIRIALDSGLRPSLIRADTGLARSRIYQINDDRGSQRDPAGHRLPCGRIECQVGDGE